MIKKTVVSIVVIHETDDCPDPSGDITRLIKFEKILVGTCSKVLKSQSKLLDNMEASIEIRHMEQDPDFLVDFAWVEDNKKLIEATYQNKKFELPSY